MLLRNTVFNLIGLGAPLLAAIATIPPLIEGLGEDRFGLLTLIWAVVGYFGLLDLGLGRALTLRLSAALERGTENEAGYIVGTALAMLSLLGGLSGLLLLLGSGPALGMIDNLPDEADAHGAIVAMAWALPFVVLTSGFRGILESKGKFLLLNALRLPIGLITFVGPWAVVAAGHDSLELIGIVLAVGRLVGCLLHGWMAWSILPVGARCRFSRTELTPLLTAGGWMTVSNVVSPLMGYADRFLIAALLSAGAVAYFATPQEIATKLWIVPAALTAVLFPRIAATGITQVREKLQRTLWQSIGALVIVIYPVIVILALFAEQILSVWIGPDFAAGSHFLLQCFAVGILLNTPAHIPLALLQGVGRAKAVAMVHLVELPVFVALTWWLLTTWSLAGAGVAWVLRCAIDTAIMFWLAGPQLGGTTGMWHRPSAMRWIWLPVVLCVPFAAMSSPAPGVRAGAAVLGIAACALAAARLWRSRAIFSTTSP